MSDATRVVVAHELDEIREAAVRVVRDAGYDAIGVADGDRAHALLLTEPCPVALVVDVGLPGRLGYELCDEIRARGLPTRVILVASVYSRTAYKRRPVALYGADGYVEQHHIQDELPRKLVALVPPPWPGRGAQVLRTPTPEQRAEAERIRRAGEGRLALDADLPPDEALRQARGLARALVADVVLYNAPRVEEGLAGGSLHELLATDLDAARALFAARVPAEVVAGCDPIGEALDDFIAHRQEGPRAD